MSINKKTITQYPDIFFSCTINKSWVGEQYIQNTRLVHLFSGKIILIESDRQNMISKNQTVLIKKNQLLKLRKEPEDDGTPFNSVVINFSKSFLQEFYLRELSGKEYNLKVDDQIRTLKDHLLLTGLFDSLAPYFQKNITPSKELMKLKSREAVLVLLEIDKSLGGFLFDFSEPGKIDLVDFMSKNYMFNVPLERFAYLTGRSLSTFKRDFQKHFGSSPHKWLTKKRLQTAHHLISENHKKPSDVYLEVGFENLSHFSRVFKDEFGYNPSYL